MICKKSDNMKAPDKIYAGTITEGFGISKRWQVCRNYLENPVEYIRKDLLLEWAKEQSASCDSAGAMKRAYDKLIDKLGSL